MSAQFQSPAKSTSNRVSKSVRSGVSRRCAADDECDECPRKRLASRPPLLQTKLIVSQPGDRYEQEAERIAQEMASAPGSAVSGRTATRPVSRIEPLGQRVVDDAETPLDQADVNPAAESAATPTSTATKAAPETTNPPTESAAPSESQTAEGTPEGATLEAAPSAGLIIEDEAPEMAPGQMRKNAFLDELRTAVCAAADAELAAVGRSTQGCPYLARWIGYYRTKDSAHIERAIRKYAPEAVGVTSAREYIPLISERVRRGVATWATTGQITGVPEELASQLPGGGLLGAVGSMVSSVASAVSSVVSGVGSVLSGIGGLFFKARDGGPHEVAGPEALRARLGSEHALDTDVRVRMEGAFGYDFSRVRVHADSRATALSASLNARAFTIGSDVAFGAGEYQPGTLSGDALLAHELAHVVQQGGAVSSDAPLRNGAAEYNALEEDADVSAVGALVSLWRGAKRGLTRIAYDAMPRLKSGLGLQRCGGTGTQVVPQIPQPVGARQAASAPCSDAERQSITQVNPCCTEPMLNEIINYRNQAIPKVARAYSSLSSPSSVSDLLWAHFRLRPDDSRVNIVREQFHRMLDAMADNTAVTFVCRSFSDPMCSGQGHPQPRSDNCKESPPRYMEFCGNYQVSVQGVMEYLPPANWVKMITHEYAHIACRNSLILGEGAEQYRSRNPYPPPAEIAFKNADCYAWFAMEVP